MTVGSRTQRRVAVLLGLLVICQTIAVAPAAAQSDDEPLFDGVIADDDSWTGAAVQTVAAATGGLARWQDSVGERIGLSDPGDATGHADAAADVIEADNDTIRTYANDRLSPTTSDEVFAVYFHDRDGNTATRYVVADVADSNWTTGPRVLTPDEFNATVRTQDHWISLDWFASKHADEEIAAFVEDYASKDENVSATERASLVSKFGSGIKSDMWGDETPAFEED